MLSLRKSNTKNEHHSILENKYLLFYNLVLICLFMKPVKFTRQ